MPGKPDPERAEVIQAWTAGFGAPPPPRLSVAFMKAALAHQRQCLASGGFPPSLRRQLSRIARDGAVDTTALQSETSGTVLVREWHGRNYQVEVTRDGYRMDGRDWSSLSAIARHITGTNWSGPRFFGTTRRTTT